MHRGEQLPARVLLVCALLTSVAWAGDAAEKRLPETAWRKTQNLPVEEVGKTIGVPVVKMLPLMQVPGKEEYFQPFWYRANGRKIHFCTLNLQTGKVKRHPVVPAYEIWSHRADGAKLYLGHNVPCVFAIYDPATDTVRNLGRIFKKALTIYRLVGGPDGTILCAGANGSTEVAVYDPKTGKAANFGPLSSNKKHGYVYYASQDDRYIYGACRGSTPWHLVALNKKTRERRVILEAPVHAHMNVSSGLAYVSDPKTKKRLYYRLDNGNAVKLDKRPAGGSGRKPAAEPRPEIRLDASTVYTEGVLTIHYRLPQDKPAREDPNATPEANGWKTTRAEAGMEGKSITRLLALDGKTVVGTSGAYGPMFVYDIEADEMQILGRPAGNAYCIGRSGDHVYVSGYPNTWFDEVDLSRPFTPTAELPGIKAVPRGDRNANPRLITYFGSREGLKSHCGVRMHTAPDGKVYVLGMRFRYFRGFAIGCYEPDTGKKYKVDDGGRLNHLNISWSCPVDGGRKLAITTRVQPNDQVKGEPPEAARLLIFDTEKGKLTQEFTPLPDEKALLTVTQAADGSLIGLVTEERYPRQSRTIIYKFDLQKGEVVARREYGGVLNGVSRKNGQPRQGPDFVTGPDGFVWTLYRLGSIPGYPYLLVRIDPNDLAIHTVGRVGAGGRFVFVGRDIYLAGTSKLRRVKNVVPEAAGN